jgi:hypothetical protein
MPTLVGCDSHSLNIFLNGTIYNFLNLPVVPKVYHLHTGTLQYPAHNVNGSIMPVEQGSSGYNAHMILRFIDGGLHISLNS